jgi:hypothetical protein
VTAGRGRREPTIPYHVSRRTSRPPERVLADIARLEVPRASVVARGSTHLVLAPGRSPRYGAGAAVTVGIAVVFGVLIASASSVALIALLPAALLPGVPLLLRHDPRVGVGAVEDAGATTVTVSGDMWSALAVALHSYLAGLPTPTTGDGASPPPETDPPAAPVGPTAVSATPASAPVASPDDSAAP